MGKKIFIYLNHIGSSTSSRQAVDLANLLAAGEDEIFLLTDLETGRSYPVSDKVSRLDCILPGDDDLGKNSPHLEHIIRRALKSTLDEIEPDCILVFGTAAAWRILKASSGKQKIYLADRVNPHQAYAGKKAHHQALRLYRKVDGVVVPTPEALEFWPEEIRKKCHVGLPLMRERFFIDPVEIPAVSRRRKAIVYAGNFKEGSGHLALVGAFENILEDYPEYCLEFYGRRSKDNTLIQVKELVRAHGLQEKVHFISSRVDMENKILDAAMFVYPSAHPGIPAILMEAMALGLPVVASDHPEGSVRAVLEDGENGLTFQAGEADELAVAMKKYLDHPQEAQRISEQAVKVRDTFSREKIASDWKQVWEERTQ